MSAGPASPPLVSAVVPLCDEVEVLGPLLQRLLPVLRAADPHFELILVDDGSRDETWSEVRTWSERENSIRGLRLSRNFGQAAALSAGLAEARGEAVFVLDADLQDPPELLPRFLEEWRAGAAVVYGVREKRKESFLQRFLYALAYRLLRRMSGTPLPVDAGDFGLLDRKVVDALVAMPERTRYLRGLRSWVGFRQVGVPYERPARSHGHSHYDRDRLVELGLSGVLSFSRLPLRLASYLGLALSGLALLGVAFYLVWWWAGFTLGGRRPQDVAGFLTLTVLVLFFSGVQLLFLGVLGEYVGRIFDEVKARPGWIVAERTDG